MTSDYNKAVGAMDDMVHRHNDQPDPPAAQFAHVDPNQFSGDEHEKHWQAIKSCEVIQQYHDAIHTAKQLAEAIGGPVKLTVWDGEPFRMGTNEMPQETYSPIKKEPT